MKDVFVILIDGEPYRKERAIRTYKTRERAEKEVHTISGYWSYRDCEFAVGLLSAEEVRKVDVKPRDYGTPPVPYVSPE